MRADRVGNGVEPRHAGLRVERDGGAQAISEVLCQVRLVECPDLLHRALQLRRIEGADAARVAEHGVGHEDVRVQVRITRHRHRNHLGDRLPVFLHRHCQRRAGRVVVEGEPADMPRLEPLPAAIADAGATDDGLQIGHGLVRGVAVGLPDSGLLGRRGERPGNRHALVRRQGEIVGADGNQLFRLPGALVGDGAHLGIVLALDLLAVGPPPGQHRADLFPASGPARGRGPGPWPPAGAGRAAGPPLAACRRRCGPGICVPCV